MKKRKRSNGGQYRPKRTKVSLSSRLKNMGKGVTL